MPKIEMLPEHNTREGFFEEHEYVSIRKHLPDYVAVICDVARITGLRKGELLSLKWTQVDFDNARINLRAVDTKNKTARFFPMTSDLREILERHKAETKKFHDLRGNMIPPYVFHRNGRKGQRLLCRMAHCLRKSRIRRKLIHDFRRTAVRNFVRKGVPEKVAMLLSGHKTRSTFERYNILNESDVLDADRRLEGEKPAEQLQNSYNRQIS
jgi:integrase